MSEKQKNQEALEKETRNALQRLLIVLLVAAGIFVYSYGWTVTEIDLAEPQEEQRQTNVTRALRELLSPRLFEQDREVTQVDASFIMVEDEADCATVDVPVQSDPATAEGAVVVIEPACTTSDAIISVQLRNADVGIDGRVRWIPPGEDATARPMEIIETEREDFVTDTNGELTATIEVPRIRGGEGELHTVRVLLAIPVGQITFSETASLVIDRMAQTIFMALVATTVAIPIAAFISFFAAQNLMRRVRLSVGSLLMAVVLFAFGVWVGGQFIVYLGRLGLQIGRGDLFAPVGALMAFVIPIVVLGATVFVLSRLTSISDDKDKNSQTTDMVRGMLNSVITTLALIFIIGAVGGLGILGGEQIMIGGDELRPAQVDSIATGLNAAGATLIWSVGNLLNILGTLIELFMPAIAGALTGFTLAGIGASVFGAQLRRMTGVPSHVLGAILGAVSGAILLAFVSGFALWAALLGILPPLIAGIIGGSVTRQIFKRVSGGNQPAPATGRSRTRRLLELASFIVGLVAVFMFMFDMLNIGRSLVDGTLPPQVPATLFGIELPLTVYMFRAAIVGAVLGGISAGLSGLQGVFPLGNMLYNTSRTSLNIIRSIEPLIMGLVFVIWVGIGPFAGVLALTLHSIAALGKLYSEQIENIDAGPIEALESTGANQLQTIIYAVVPQIIPPYIAFTMYRWDINVRMSTIIGFVGGGGIGLLLQQQINLLRYRDAGVAVLAIAVVVSILDYASASIRERLT
ncbi:MAG: ABC transporter permease subunit [Chloroflexota bacterium]